MARLDRELDQLREMVDNGGLADGRDLIGVEVEFHLIDSEGRPSLRNSEVLDAVADGPYDVQAELARSHMRRVEIDPQASLRFGGVDGVGLDADVVIAADVDLRNGTSQEPGWLLATVRPGRHDAIRVLDTDGRHHEGDARHHRR
jgi:hypothetical protein